MGDRRGAMHNRTRSLTAPRSRSLKESLIGWNSAITGLLVTAIAIRIRYLWTHHLWNDELSTMQAATIPWSEAVEYLKIVDPHPPASFLFVKGVDLLFAYQLTIDQLKYGVLFWTVVIGLVSFWVVRRLPWLALPVLAGLSVVAVNPLFAYLGSEVRPYSMLIALAFALLMFSSLWITTTHRGTVPGRRAQVVMVVLLALPVWTQYAGILLVVGVVISIEMISIVRRRKLDLLLIRVALVAALLAAPVAFFLKSQMAIDVPTARTPFPELAGYLGWGFGGLGVFLAVGALIAWVVEFSRRTGRGEPPTSSSDHRHELVAVGWYSLTVVVLFFLGVAVVWFATGIQLANIGVSIVPVLFAVVGFACLLTALREDAVKVLIVITVVLSFPLALIVTDSPQILRPNRIANVDILVEISGTVGFDDVAGDGTMLISLDGFLSNRYFVSHAESEFPAARVEPVPVTQFDTRLEATIAAGIEDPEINRVVLITRYNFDYRVLPFIPEGIRLVRVHKYAWLMEIVEQDNLE